MNTNTQSENNKIDIINMFKIIRLFYAFNYNNGSQMSIQQYDSIIQTCVLFWRDKNFELFRLNPKYDQSTYFYNPPI